MTAFEKLEKEFIKVSSRDVFETDRFAEVNTEIDRTYNLIRMRIASEIASIFTRIMSQANDLHENGIEITDEWVKNKKETYKGYFLKTIKEFWPED